MVVHGNPDATKHLAEYCRKNSDMEVKTVFTPNTGETVDATRESHIYQVVSLHLLFCVCFDPVPKTNPIVLGTNHGWYFLILCLMVYLYEH